MSLFITIFTMLLTLFPEWLAIAIMGFISMLLIILVIKIVAFVLDAIPFL